MASGTNKRDSEFPTIDKEALVTVYLGLVEVANKNEKWDASDVAESVDLQTQETEIILDELAHMGLVKEQDSCWRPVIT
jgi:predicted transcriptional regulator